MRITNKTTYIGYLGQLERIQNDKYNQETQLNTGHRLNSIDDSPETQAEVKLLNAKINRNDGYQNTIQDVIREMESASELMESVYDKVSEIRLISFQAIQAGTEHSTLTFATQIKNLLVDMIDVANTDYKGRTLFSGTATTVKSVEIDPLDPNLGAYQPLSSNELPFELIEDPQVPPDPNNPSGLVVIFKGNNNDRIVNTGQNSSEAVNAKAEDIFGTGVEPKVFEDIIKIYNTLFYKQDGTPRTSEDYLVKSERDTIESLQKDLFEHNQKLTNTIAQLAAKHNRLESLSDQITNENTMLRTITSQKSDTDYAKTTIALRGSETALQYSLQIGARMMQSTLFDFLR